MWTVSSLRQFALYIIVIGFLSVAAFQIKVTDVTWKYLSYIWDGEYET